jgi:hypothetical protein
MNTRLIYAYLLVNIVLSTVLFIGAEKIIFVLGSFF